MNDKDLLALAKRAREFAYAPYSGFYVAAALLCKDGTVYTGCNIENAAYSPTNCAERTAFFKAVSEGALGFTAIAIAGDREEYLAPCGVCRQVMAEFCDVHSFRVILAKSKQEYQIVTLKELLPRAFSGKDLRG